MKLLNVCFVGYGSIAKRHIKNLYTLCHLKKIDLKIDVLRHKESKDYNEKYEYVNSVKYRKLLSNEKYDILFVTNPTSEHYKILKLYKDNAKMFFIEKPLVNYVDVNKIKKISIAPNRIYVACPLRYKQVIQYIRNNIDLNNVICVRTICSSYLPNWRFGVDYKKTYSANKKLGGGVRLDLIHEWDYLKYLFGKPNNIIYQYGKYSKLKIDTEDVASYIARYNNKIIELHIDYFGQVYQRKVQLYFDDDVVEVDLYKNTIKFLLSNNNIIFDNDYDNCYVNEMNHFLDIFYKKVKNDNNMTNSIDTIELTRGKV